MASVTKTLTDSVEWISGETLKARLPYPKVIEALKGVFDPAITAPPRHVHSLAAPGQDARLLLIKPAWRDRGFFGIKLATYFAENRAQELPVVSSIYIAFDGATGRPRAILDGDALTNIRTAALVALAGLYMARPDSRVLLLVGTGTLSPHIALAHASVQRNLERVLVWGRRREAAERTAAQLRESSLDAQPVDSIEEGLRLADMVSCATSSSTPLVKGDDVRPGTHLDLVGGFTPQMREVDDRLVAKARVVLETIEGVATTAGDIVGPLESGAITRAALKIELQDLLSGRAQGRQSPDELTLFKTVGDAREDLCAAELAFAAAGDH